MFICVGGIYCDDDTVASSHLNAWFSDCCVPAHKHTQHYDRIIKILKRS